MVMDDVERTTPAPDLRLYKPKEAAAYLGVSSYWLLKQAREGKIRHRRYGSKIIRFAAEDLEEFKRQGDQPVAGGGRRSRRRAS